MIRLLALALLLALPAQAEPPAAPEIPADADHIVQHAERWAAICKDADDKPYTCWVYVVTRRAETDCSRADVNGDGVVGVGDFVAMSQQIGCSEPTEDDSHE